MTRRTPESVLDEYLVVASQGGDRRALRRLVERWDGRFLRLAHRYLGDRETSRDVVQEAWMAVIRGLPGLSDPARFRAWAFRIVSNKARDWIRRERRRRKVAGVLSRPGRDGSCVGPSEARGSDLEHVRRGLADLSDRQRIVLSLYYVDDMSVGEIGEALGVPAGTVKSRLFHARRALRDTLERNGRPNPAVKETKP